MNSTNLTIGKTIQNYGWVLLFIVAFLQSLSGLFLLVFSGPEVFEGDTGVSWFELSHVFPSVAAQFTMAQQSALVGSLAIGLFSMAVITFAFRERQRWSWLTMWILPVSMVPGTVSLARTENQAGIALFGGSFVLLAVAGLLLSFRAFFPRKTAQIKGS